MIGIHHYALFLTTGFLLNLTPGPDTFYILGRTLSQGRKAGVFSVLGIGCGCLFHTLCAAIGLSAILYASALAFLVVKLAGAAYLVYQGLRMLFSRRSGEGTSLQTLAPEAPRTLFLQGFLTNVLNPKVALFFLAFLPQFVDAGSSSHMLPFLILGLTFVTTGTLWCLCLVFMASGIRRTLNQVSGLGTWIDRCAGSLFVLLGLRLVFSRR